MGKVKITWLGHAAFKVQGSGKIIYIDPWIDENPMCPIKMGEIASADLVCVTHGHNDHLGNSLEIAKKTGGILVCSPEIAIYAAKKGIEYDKGSWPLNIGGTGQFGNVQITMVNAVHTSEILGEEFKEDGTVMPGSGACGFVIKFRNGLSIYYGGDTGLFGDMALIGRLYAPQVAILPIGGKYNMGIYEAAYAASLVRPKIVIPMHYNTFDDQRANVDEFKQRVKFLSPHIEVVVLSPGETFEYDLRNL